MAATAIPVEIITRAGLLPTEVDSDEANGNSIALTGQNVVRIENTDVSDRTVTFIDQVDDTDGYKHDEGGIIPAGEVRYYGPFRVTRWADSGGLLQMTWSAGTAATCKVESSDLKSGNPDVDTKG